MSEFHRMITYLYLYEQGTKSRNIGFAKIERRDRQCLLEIHMKNTGCSLTPVPVYFYVQKGSKLAGILLGNFSLNRGSGDFNVILDAQNIKDSGYVLDDVKGIYVPLTVQMMSVSQWDDDEFHQEDFIDLTEILSENSMSEEKPQNQQAPLQAAEKSPSAHDAEDSPPQQTTEASISTQDTATPMPEQQKSTDALKALEALPRPVEESSGQSQAENSHRQPQAGNPRRQSRAENSHRQSQAESSHRQSQAGNPRRQSQADSPHKQPQAENSHEQSREKAPEDWDIRWRFIQENYPVMTPFAGDEQTICIRMELKDLRQLPKQFWYLGNNSFLLHGFFNYRYYVLGMTEEFGVKKWFIGVPGVFQNPERVMAALFGFPEFRSEKPSPIKTGEFGYWYRYLNELSEPADKSGN